MTQVAQQKTARRTVRGQAEGVKRKRTGPRPLPAVALPGERALESRIVDTAVSDLNQIYTLKGLETARAVGEYVLARFFGGDITQFRHRGVKHISFRTLADRDDLQFSYSFLWNSVAVVEQLRQMPKEIADALSLSHHKLLLPVRDPGLKLELAQRAVRDKLSKRDLEGEIARYRKRDIVGARRGRKPAHPLAKGLAKIRKALHWTLEQSAFDHLNELGPEESKRLSADLDHELDAIGHLLNTLRQRCR